MKSILSILLCAAALSLLSGCDASSGVTARIQEKSSVFSQLTPEQKNNIEKQVIEVGYTADMVYMSLGKPNAKVTRETPDGPVEMWTYRNFFVPQGFTTAADARQQYTANLAERGPGNLQTFPKGSDKPIANTRGGVQTNLYLPELQSDTLHVQFFNGRVFSIKLESED